MSVLRRARGYAPLECTEQTAQILESIREVARNAGPGHVGVFDLDGCLFDTRPRQVQIFRELASTKGFDSLARVEAAHFLDWNLDHTLANAGLDPAWIHAHSHSVRAWWESYFFTSRYVEFDHAMPGSAALIRTVHEAGLHVVYLTGRDESMKEGTENALRRFGFPYDGDRATLLVKPDFRMDDTAFKEAAIERIARLGRVVLYLDNEPANVNLFRRCHPEALVVFVETDHSPKPIAPDGEIPWLRSFLAAAV